MKTKRHFKNKKDIDEYISRYREIKNYIQNNINIIPQKILECYKTPYYLELKKYNILESDYKEKAIEDISQIVHCNIEEFSKQEIERYLKELFSHEIEAIKKLFSEERISDLYEENLDYIKFKFFEKFKEKFKSINLTEEAYYNNDIFFELKQIYDSVENLEKENIEHKAISLLSSKYDIKKHVKSKKEKQLIEFIKYRDKSENKQKKCYELLNEVSKILNISNSNIRKWFENHQQYLPNYKEREHLGTSELLMTITEDDVIYLFKNEKRIKENLRRTYS